MVTKEDFEFLRKQNWTTEKNGALISNPQMWETLKKDFETLTEADQMYLGIWIKKLKEEQNIFSSQAQVLQLIITRQEDKATELVADIIKRNYKITSIKQDRTSELWVKVDGIFKQNGEATIKEICRQIFGEAYTPQRANKVIAKIEADTFEVAEVFFRKAQQNKEEIPVLNGVLNLKTRQLRPYSDSDVFFHKINAEYNPNAKCPNTDKFLREVLKYGDDSKVFYESCGYDLYKDNFLEVFFILYGDGGNGKSKTISIKKRFLGVDNCCSIPLNQLVGDSFSVSGLFGKLANLSGDISNTDLKDTGMIKQLTGRDLITAKRKFMTDLIFDNFCKFYFSLNEFCKVYDLSAGFWRRLIVLEFPYKFVPKAEYDRAEDKTNLKIQDPEILEKITTPEEMSGLLNQSLDGLDRLRQNKRFSYTKGTAEIKEFWIRKSDSFTAFCMDCLEGNAEGYISKKELRRAFNIYCKKHRVKGASDKAIKVTLEDMFGVTDGAKYTGLDKEYIWEGISFRQERQGFSPLSEIGNNDIRSKRVSNLSNEENNPEKDILEALKILQEETGQLIPLDKIKQLPFENLEDSLIKLEKSGQIFQPKPGYFQLL